MAAKSLVFDEDLCCSVCCDIFKDPVVLECSHSFCKDCLQQFWKQKDFRECPVCRSKLSMEPLTNLVLRNIVESCLKQKNGSEAKEETKSKKMSEDRCSLHGKKLLLFCEEDQEPLCAVCQTSKKHRNHQVCPVEEAAEEQKEELKTALSPIKQKLERFAKVEREWKETATHIRSQAQHTELQVKAEFKRLHQFLHDEEEARLAALKKEEDQKCQMMKEKIENITKCIAILSEKAITIQKAMNAEDIHFLKIHKDLKERAQCTVEDPELPSGALINVAKHLDNLRFRVWEKILGMVQYSPVTLDPNTAFPWLSLSEDLTSVGDTNTKQKLPDNPERFDSSVSVLGSEGFISGKHSWEVEVGNQPEWDVGVVKESINRKGHTKIHPTNGFWVLVQRQRDEYKAGGVSILLKKKPQRIRVLLDYDKGEVSFFDASDMSHIYTFRGTFTETLYPYFSPSVNTAGSEAGALQIRPMMVSVRVSETSSL